MSSRRESQRLPGTDEREDEEVRDQVKAWISAHPQYCAGPYKGQEYLGLLSKMQEEAAKKDAENAKRIEALTTELGALRHSHLLLIKANDDVIADVNREKVQKEVLERQLAEKDADLKAIQDRVGNEDKELQEARAQRDQVQQLMEQERRAHMEDVNSLQREVEKWKTVHEEEKRKYAAFLAAAGKEKTPTDVVVEHMTVEKSLLEKKLQDCRVEVDELEQMNAYLQHQLTQREESSQTVSRGLKEQLQASSRRIRDLEVEKNVLAYKNKDLEGDNKQLTRCKMELTNANMQLHLQQEKLERCISAHIRDQWTDDVTRQHRKLEAERERWEALENRNAELELQLSGLQRQYQLKVNCFQILERQNELEARTYEGERERWMNEKESLERQLFEKENTLQRKETELLVQQEGIHNAEDEKKQFQQKLLETEAKNEALQTKLDQLANRVTKLRHQQRSRTSSFTESNHSSLECSVPMSTLSSTASLRERVAALEQMFHHQQLQERRRSRTYTQGVLHGGTSDRYDLSPSSTLTESFPSSHTSHYSIHSQAHLLSSFGPVCADNQEPSASKPPSHSLPHLDSNLVCTKCNKQFRHGEKQDFRAHCKKCFNKD